MTGDPDLDQACEDMAPAANRLRHLQQLVASIDPIKDYSTMVMRRSELADAEEEFRVRGERLCIDKDRRVAGRALLTVVEEVQRLRRGARGRRPTSDQVVRAVRATVEASERDRVEADADLNLARLSAVLATNRARSAAAALSYMEASR